MKNKILVIGGYGQVGQVICKDLGKKFPGKVIAAGRNFEKAKQFSLKTEGGVAPLQFDAFANHKKNEILDDVTLVVMCLDQRDTQFIETCIEKKRHYIDITASYKLLSQVESLDIKAKESGATIVLGVGLCPGLTNMLVKYSKSYFDSIDAAEIYIMLGLGDKHGKAATEWTIDNMNSVFSVMENNSFKRVGSFEDGKKTVSTRLCFDSVILTNTFALLKRIGFFNLLKINLFRNVMVKIFENFHWGSDLYVLKVDTKGIKKHKEALYQCLIRGSNEGQATGKVAAIVAESLYTKKFPAGVYYLEQLFELEEFLSKLKKCFEFSITTAPN